MKKSKIILFAFLIIIAYCNIWATDGWLMQNITPAGDVVLHSVFFINTNTGWAVGSSGTILKTTDGGSTWTTQYYGEMFIGDVFFINSNTGWAVSGSTLLKTTDGGTNWMKLSGPVGSCIFFLDANTGWITSDYGYIIKTTDGGTHWTEQTTPVNDYIYDIYFVNSSTGWAVGENGTILKTTDGGTNWSSQTSPTISDLKSVFFVDQNLGFAVGNEGRILRTTDGGAYWSLKQPTSYDFQSVYFIGNTGWVVGELGKRYKTTDGGITWNTFSPGTFFISLNYYSVHFEDVNTGWIVGDRGGISKTTDGGNNWVSQNIGSSYRNKSVFFTDYSNGWRAGLNESIWKTTDGGTSWNSQYFGDNSDFYGLYFINSSTGWAVGSSGDIVKTTNGGTNWIEQTNSTTFQLNAVTFCNANTGWAVGNSGTILKTTDGGTNWTAQSSGTTTDLKSVCFYNTNIAWAAGDNCTILKTTDGGISWLSQFLPCNNEFVSHTDLKSIFFIDIIRGWTVGDSPEVYKTTDGGNSWHTFSLGYIYSNYIWDHYDTYFDYLKSVYFINNSVGYTVGFYGGIYKTTDGGVNWFRQASHTNSSLYSVFFMDNNTGWAVGDNGNILKTTNGGVSLPYLTTDVSSVSSNSSVVTGEIRNLGGTQISTKGFCWNTTGQPTLSDSHTEESGTFREYYNFSSTITPLTPGTTYYVRSYATNPVGTGYGEELPFTTIDFPELSVPSINNITINTAFASSSITDTGGAPVTTRGFCWNTTGNPTISDSKTQENGTFGLGLFTGNITGLSGNTIYHVKAYATNSDLTGYSGEATFSTCRTLTVTNTNDNGAGSLRQAILDANAYSCSTGNKITFAPGVSGTITLTTGQLGIYSSMTITGPGASTLSVSGDGSCTVLHIYNGSDNVEISGLSIINGNGSNAGGINIDGPSSTLSLSSCTLSNNRGWGIYNNFGCLSISNVTITNPAYKPPTLAGGIWSNDCSQFYIDNSNIINNSIIGIYFERGNLTINSSTISYNSSSNENSGLVLSRTNFILNNSNITNNISKKYSGIYLSLSSATINYSTISNNSATLYYGGGIGNYQSNLIITNSTISNNDAFGRSGGIDNYSSSTLTLTNSTIAYNHSNIDNSGSDYGGGIYNNSSTLTIKNTLIAHNYRGSGTTTPDDFYYVSGTITNNGYNLVEAQSHSHFGAGNNDITGNQPNLNLSSTLSDNSSIYGTNTLALLPGSVAINKASDIKGSHPISIPIDDQRGIERLSPFDIGAYEYQDGPPYVNTSIPFNITGITAECGGTVTAEGSGTVSTRGIVWSTSPKPTLLSCPSGSYTANGSGTGTFSTTITGLVGETTYYVRAYATNSEGTRYGGEQTFTTGFCLVVQNLNDCGPCSLRQAIIAANSNPDGNLITFAQGLSGTIILTTGELSINSSMTITGPGASVIAISGNDASRVFIINSGNVVITGLHINDGNGNSIYNGGGIYCSSATLTVSSCVISGNGARYGGGIYNSNGYMTISNTNIQGNSAVNQITPSDCAGGGIFNRGSILLNSSTITYCHGSFAGGIANYGSMTITNTPLSNNGANYFDGGGISNGGYLSISSSSISNNDAKNDAFGNFGNGGGISNYGTNLMNNSTISNNEANRGGGISNGGSMTITNSTISGNSAMHYDGGSSNYHGGGISNEGNMILANSTISGNISVVKGGGIYNTSLLTLTNATIANNVCDLYMINYPAHNYGGGIYNSSTVTIINTLIARNYYADLPEQSQDDFYSNSSGTINNNGYNLVEIHNSIFNSGQHDITGYQTNLNLSETLALNSSTLGTQTLALDDGSVAIDAGTSLQGTHPVFIPTTDQRNWERNCNPDIGAYENGSTSCPFKLVLQDIEVNTNQIFNYSASRTITTGSFGRCVRIPFIVSSGTVTLVAGTSINLQPCTRIGPNVYFRAMIVNPSCSCTFTPRQVLPPIEEEHLPVKNYENISEDNELMIFPNPNTGIFTIRLKNPAKDEIIIDIKNIFGCSVFKEYYNKSNTFEINMKEKSKGMYFVKVSIGNKIYISKMIVE
jgi:photosystem II stability/assembly factor-like uncharacterized protein